METFTPIAGLIGGLMIGLAAVLLLLFNGRIAGISGIVGGALAARSGDVAWRIAFIAGLIGGAVIMSAAHPPALDISPPGSIPLLIVAGLLVGIGTRLGNGCTSGHGVCGIARGSGRSIAATVVFFAAAATTVFVARHLLGA